MLTDAQATALKAAQSLSCSTEEPTEIMAESPTEEPTAQLDSVSISDLTRHSYQVLSMVQQSNKPMLIVKNGRALAQIVPVEGAALLGVKVNLHKISN